MSLLFCKMKKTVVKMLYVNLLTCSFDDTIHLWAGTLWRCANQADKAWCKQIRKAVVKQLSVDLCD